VKITGGVMRAVGFRRQGINLDVALRYRFAWSLEHFSFVSRLLTLEDEFYNAWESPLLKA
jgi:hypothetical protein